jgi:hypothetical protein
MKMVLKAPGVSPPSLSHRTLNNWKHSFILVYERLDSESPQQSTSSKSRRSSRFPCISQILTEIRSYSLSHGARFRWLPLNPLPLTRNRSWKLDPSLCAYFSYVQGTIFWSQSFWICNPLGGDVDFSCNPLGGDVDFSLFVDKSSFKQFWWWFVTVPHWNIAIAACPFFAVHIK